MFEQKIWYGKWTFDGIRDLGRLFGKGMSATCVRRSGVAQNQMTNAHLSDT